MRQYYYNPYIDTHIKFTIIKINNFFWCEKLCFVYELTEYLMIGAFRKIRVHLH